MAVGKKKSSTDRQASRSQRAEKANKKPSQKSSQRAKRKSARALDLPQPVYRKTILPNGIRVITEAHPQSRAVSCGIWVNKGTRDERPDEAGLAHFVEHLVFKRTAKRNAYQISRDMEAVGGELNAFTSREYTCFVTHSLKEHVGLSLDVLSDLVFRPKFDKNDIQKEKQVVIQEIAMAEDQLEDAIFDKYFERVYADAPLGKPILGSVKSIQDMKRATIMSFHRRQYTIENAIVSVAGNVDHDEVLELVLKHAKPQRSARISSAKSNGKVSDQAGVPVLRERPEMKLFRDVIHRPSEQVHMVLGIPANEFRDPLRFEGFVVNTLLGGGLTSRLYQTVRENRGLVYSIYSQLTTFTDAGLNLIYAGTEPKNMPEVLELTLKEIRKLKKNGITRQDLELFKTQVKGQILLGADDVENRMNSLGVNEMVFGRYRSVDSVMQEVEAVSLDSVHEYIEKFVDLERMSVLLMGPLPEGPTRKWLEQL